MFDKFIYLFDLLFLPRETRILGKINKIATRANDILYRTNDGLYLDEDFKELLMLDDELSFIRTKEHKDKIKLWRMLIGLTQKKFINRNLN